MQENCPQENPGGKGEGEVQASPIPAHKQGQKPPCQGRDKHEE